MSEFDILVAMATDSSNSRLFFEKVPRFAKNVLPNYFKILKYTCILAKYVSKSMQ